MNSTQNPRDIRPRSFLAASLSVSPATTSQGYAVSFSVRRHLSADLSGVLSSIAIAKEEAQAKSEALAKADGGLPLHLAHGTAMGPILKSKMTLSSCLSRTKPVLSVIEG